METRHTGQVSILEVLLERELPRSRRTDLDKPPSIALFERDVPEDPLAVHSPSTGIGPGPRREKESGVCPAKPGVYARLTRLRRIRLYRRLNGSEAMPIAHVLPCLLVLKQLVPVSGDLS